MARAQSPIKVHESTKEKVRYAALMAGLKQSSSSSVRLTSTSSDIRVEFQRRMERVQEALLGGKASTLAYGTGVSEDDVARVGGVTADQVRYRRPMRAASNQGAVPKSGGMMGRA